jgi:hypothetical protein
MTNAQIAYALLVGFISAIGALIGNWLSSRAALRSSINALQGIDRQIRLQRGTKDAEFRQAWINELREAMANFQSFGVTPEADQQKAREFYKYGTQIELMMNRADPNYPKLQEAMYRFLAAESAKEKFRCNEPFVEVCQDILKTEWEVLKKRLEEASAERTSS